MACAVCGSGVALVKGAHKGLCLSCKRRKQRREEDARDDKKITAMVGMVVETLIVKVEKAEAAAAKRAADRAAAQAAKAAKAEAKAIPKARLVWVDLPHYNTPSPSIMAASIMAASPIPMAAASGPAIATNAQAAALLERERLQAERERLQAVREAQLAEREAQLEAAHAAQAAQAAQLQRQLEAAKRQQQQLEAEERARAEAAEAAEAAERAQAEAAEREAAVAERPVRVRMRGIADLVRANAPQPPPPPGCRLYRRALRRARCILQEPALTARALAGGDNIKAGQSDGKRKQVDLDAHDEAARDVHAVLQQQGELAGRRPAEWRALHSQPGCKRQKRHWDYNPNEVRNLRQLGLRVPCSVIAAMQDGAQLLVWDHERGVEVPVVMFAGDVLVFDGDVVHAGAQYSVGSTRVHVYLDVPELERDPNFTWPFGK
jgi:hypothetical protein